MPAPFYLLVAHAVVAADGLKASAELTQTLAKAGLDKAKAAEAEKLAHDGEHLIEARREQFEDRISEHAMHAATAELEMWLQTVRFQLKKGLEPEVLESVMGKHIHAHDHTVTAIAQALRTLASIRTNDKVAEAIGDDRKVHDVAGRGWTLLKRLTSSTDIRLEKQDNEDGKVFGQIDAHANALSAWLGGVDDAASKLEEKSQSLLALLGWVPQGIGRPLGGAGFSVKLHERGQGEVPAPGSAFPSTGWSIGRQGRNRENLGKGWVEPTFK